MRLSGSQILYSGLSLPVCRTRYAHSTMIHSTEFLILTTHHYLCNNADQFTTTVIGSGAVLPAGSTIRNAARPGLPRSAPRSAGSRITAKTVFRSDGGVHSMPCEDAAILGIQCLYRRFYDAGLG